MCATAVAQTTQCKYTATIRTVLQPTTGTDSTAKEKPADEQSVQPACAAHADPVTGSADNLSHMHLPVHIIRLLTDCRQDEHGRGQYGGYHVDK